MIPPSARLRSLVALFAVYLVLLVWTVLWKLEVPWVGGDTMVKLVPFVRTSEAGPSAPAEVVANLVLFVPFGIYLGLVAPSSRWWTAAAVMAGTSFALEVAQYVLAVGRTDTTDVIANTVGGLVGLALVAATRHRLAGRTPTVMLRVCSVATALVLLAGITYAVSPWQPVHVRDVGPLSRTDCLSPQDVETDDCGGSSAPGADDPPRSAARAGAPTSQA